jgi:hypothetical protein
MRDIERAVTVLIRDTAVENDEAELARLRNLPPAEQLGVAMVLHEAMRQAAVPNGYANEGLLRVRSVAAAQQYLLTPGRSAPVPQRHPRLSGE